MKKISKFFLLLILLMAGMSNAWAYDAAKGTVVYLDNSVGAWTNTYKQFLIGHSNYSRCYTLKQITNTQLWYDNSFASSTAWSGYADFAFIGNSSEWGVQDYYNATPSTRKSYATTKSGALAKGLSGLNVYSTTGSNNLNEVFKNVTYDALNSSQKLSVRVSTDGGDYSAPSTNPANLAVTGKAFSDWKTCNTSKNATATAAESYSSPSASIGYTATTTMTISNVQANYTFVGFYDAETEGNELMSAAEAQTASGITGTYKYEYLTRDANTVYARFTYTTPSATTWTVKFNPNGGKWSDESTTTKEVIVDKGESIDLVTPTKEGYTFTGWWDATSGGNKVIEPTATSYTPEANKTVNAQWIERTITLQKSDYNGLQQAITLTASDPTGFTPTSYTFYYSKDGGDYTAIGEASATATYTPTAAGSYTFKVIASDGTYNVEATTTAVTCNIPAYLVYATGNADWNAKAAASAAVDNIISVTIDGNNLRYSSASGQTGYCFFAFRIDDATGWTPTNCFGSTKTNADEEVKTDGTATNSKINPSKGLYIKPGTDKADYTFTFSFNITNAEVSVTKTHKPVTVTYNANNATEGTVPVDDTQYEVNTTVTVKENSGNLARTGYTYEGWNTKNDGTGTTYSAVEPLGTFEITANTTLFAKWNTIPYTITYVLPEGASKGDNPDTYTIETATITLKAASMEGKVFDGWFSEPEFTNQVTEIAKGSMGDKTLYAKFHDIQTYRLYYSNPDGWATVYAYLWKNGGDGKNKDWPGEAITANTVVINNRTFYYYEFDETKGWDRIIFNNCANSTATSPKTGDITFSVPANDGQYNNAKASATGTWQPLPEPIDPETPYTTIKVLCDYDGTTPVKIFFKDISSDFMVIDAEEDGTTGEYTMNALGQQTIDESTGYLYEISFYGTCKMAIFVSKSHIGTANKLTAQDVDLTAAARVTYYYDLTGVKAGSPTTNIFTKIMLPLTQGYGTFCYPQAVKVSQAAPFWMEIEENTEETSGYELMMTAMEDNILPANTGALIYSKQQNAQAILTVVESTATYPDNDFEGTTVRTAMPELATGEKVYVLGNRPSTGIAFYDYQPTTNYIPAYKAYFRLTPAAEPQGAPSRVKMTFRTEPTRMESATYNLQPATSKMLRNGQLIIIRDGKTYNAQGARL